jgi:hypothetical protein
MGVIQTNTYHDIVDYLVNYAGGDTQGKTITDAQRAVTNAYREFNASHAWSFLYQRGRLVTVAPYKTGSVAYVQATRQVTLTGGTWPSWAAFADIAIPGPTSSPPGYISYNISALISSTVIQLSVNSNPGVDIAAGATFELWRDTYPMPCDFQQTHDMVELVTGQVCQFVPPNDWMQPQRMRSGPAKPVQFCVTADPHYLGTMAARFYPRPDNAYIFDFMYKRRPRQLIIMNYATGTVSTTISSQTINGSSTAWASKYAGSVIRFGDPGSKAPPTALTGIYPYRYERVLSAWTDPVTMTVDESLPETLANVPYRISDPIDIEDGVALTAFLRECEAQYRLFRRIKSIGTEDADRQMAILKARENDHRGMSIRVAGGVVAYRRRLANMPITFEA